MKKVTIYTYDDNRDIINDVSEIREVIYGKLNFLAIVCKNENNKIIKTNDYYVGNIKKIVIENL